jgi:hypothetical protein
MDDNLAECHHLAQLSVNLVIRLLPFLSFDTVCVFALRPVFSEFILGFAASETTVLLVLVSAFCMQFLESLAELVTDIELSGEACFSSSI